MEPGVGRIVRYHAPAAPGITVARAALIESGCVCGCETADLTVFAGGPHFVPDVKFSKLGGSHTWSWPRD